MDGGAVFVSLGAVLGNLALVADGGAGLAIVRFTELSSLYLPLVMRGGIVFKEAGEERWFAPDL